MTEQEVIEGNKLIAIFDGFVLHTDDPDYGEVFYAAHDKYKISRYPMYEIKYHSSWDWLIPVIQKANNLELKDIVVNDSVQIYVTKIGKVKRELMRLNLEKTFLHLVTFITWYNTNKPTQT